MAHWRPTYRFTSILALVCGLNAPPVAAAKFQLAITGMVAFAPADDGSLDVLLVNEFDPPAHGMHEITHFPQLEIQCAHLKDKQLREDCGYWASSPYGAGRVVALDAGFEVRLRFGGQAPSGEVTRDKSFDLRVVPLGKAAGAKAEAAVLRKEVFAPATSRSFAVARTRLAGGAVSVGKSLDGVWSFRAAGGPPVLTLAEGGDIATWTREFDATQGVQIELWPFGAAQPARVLDLKSSGDMVVTLSNEPDPTEFCAHAPTRSDLPSSHFRRFWELSKFAGTHASADLETLPLPYPEDPSLDCSPAAFLRRIMGRRVNCRMAYFASRE